MINDILDLMNFRLNENNFWRSDVIKDKKVVLPVSLWVYLNGPVRRGKGGDPQSHANQRQAHHPAQDTPVQYIHV